LKKLGVAAGQRTMNPIDAIRKQLEGAVELWEDCSRAQVADLWTAFAFCLLISALRLLSKRPRLELSRWLVVPEKRTDEKIQKVSKNIFGFVFFFVIVSMEYYLFGDAPFLSSELGGKHPGPSVEFRETFFKYCHDYKFQPGEKMFYLIAFGYHGQSLLWTLVRDRAANDFWELLIHHVATCTAIYCSFLGMAIGGGVPVLIMHDITDVTLYIAKILGYTSLKMCQTVAFLFMALTFVYFRLWAFPRATLVPVYMQLTTPPEERLSPMDIADQALWISWSAAVALFFVHIFWFTRIYKIGYSKLTKGNWDHVRLAGSRGLKEERLKKED